MVRRRRRQRGRRRRRRRRVATLARCVRLGLAGQVGWNEKDPVSKTKHDSCLAVGRTEPDPSKDLTFEGFEDQVSISTRILG